MRWSCCVALVLTAICVAPAAAQDEPPAEPPPQEESLPEDVTPEVLEAGREVFVGAGGCYVCHGKAGDGTPMGPSLTDAEWLHAEAGSFEEIIGVVNAGVTEPQNHPAPMLPRGGTDITYEQARAVAAYVWTLSRSEGDEDAGGS